MKIQNVNDASFKKYGKILKGYPVDKILKEIQIPGAFCGLVGENITLK